MLILKEIKKKNINDPSELVKIFEKFMSNVLAITNQSNRYTIIHEFIENSKLKFGSNITKIKEIYV